MKLTQVTVLESGMMFYRLKKLRGKVTDTEESHRCMSDEQLEALIPWSEEVQIVCKN